MCNLYLRASFGGNRYFLESLRIKHNDMDLNQKAGNRWRARLIKAGGGILLMALLIHGMNHLFSEVTKLTILRL